MKKIILKAALIVMIAVVTITNVMGYSSSKEKVTIIKPYTHDLTNSQVKMIKDKRLLPVAVAYALYAISVADLTLGVVAAVHDRIGSNHIESENVFEIEQEKKMDKLN